jgi:ClpP class serine protease
MNVYYALGAEYLEHYYVFRELEAKVRKEISVEMIKAIQDGTVSFTSEAPLLVVEQGIARIKIEGMLQQRSTVSASLLGPVTTYEAIEQAIAEAVSDYAVREIEFHLSSPGGTWEGIDYCAEMIAKAGKPTTAIVYNEAHSGGYYLASQADTVYAVTRGSLFGSIGVAAELFDRTEEEGKKGIRRLVFTNSQSKDKRPDPATEAGASVVQEHLDMLYDIFEQRVIAGRRKQVGDFSQEHIRALRGRSVSAVRALEIGLIDGIISDEPEDGQDKSRKGVNSVKLAEFTAQGAEAEQELTEYTRAAVKASEERMLEIVKLSGAVLSERAEAAIRNGQDAGAFAREELSALRESLAVPNGEQLGTSKPDTSLKDVKEMSRKTSGAFAL